MSFKKIFTVTLLIVLTFSLLTGQVLAKGNYAFYAFNSKPILDWDPSVMFSNGIVILNNVYEPLLRYDPLADEIINVLATDYEKSDDGLTWTFKIREGVKFHDGTDLNAEAVKFSVERTIEMNRGAAFIWASVDSVEVIDDYTVQFNLQYPAPLDLICASGYAAFIMSPSAVKSGGEDYFKTANECGTGPYMLESSKNDEEIVLTKFDDYWQGWEGKHFEKAVIQQISEVATRRQLVEQGVADITLELTPGDIEALENNPDVNIDFTPSFENLQFFMNTEKEPLNNKLVRKALSYAFPYQDVIDVCQGGFARQAHGPIPYGLWGHSEDLLQYTHDLDKARELLAQAGYEEGFELLLTYMSGDESERKAAELFKSELAKLNINLSIRGMPWESQWALARSDNKEEIQDIFVMYWWPDISDPSAFLYSTYHSEEEVYFNMAYWDNKEFDNLLDEASRLSGIDREEAEETIIEAQEVFLEESPSILVYDKQYIRASHSSFKGYKNNPSYPNVVFFYETYREN